MEDMTPLGFLQLISSLVGIVLAIWAIIEVRSLETFKSGLGTIEAGASKPTPFSAACLGGSG